LSVAHHIAIDLWSTVFLMSEFQLVYEALRHGQRPGLPPPRARYSDFVAWQEKILTSAEGERQRAYWARRFSGEVPELVLPTDRPRLPAPTFRGAAHPFQLRPGLTRRMKDLARQERATLFVPLLAGLYTLLHRYTGQVDIVVGSMGAGRSRPEFQTVVGFFANLLPLRVDLSGRPTFRSLLGQVREVVLEGIDHQNYPFPLLVQQILHRRDSSANPLCNVLIQLNAHQVDLVPDAVRAEAASAPGCMASVHAEGLSVELYPLEQPIAKVDLSLILYQTVDGLAGWMEFSTDLFERNTVRRMVGHWLSLLEAGVAEPDQPLATLPLLSPREREQMLRGWNDTTVAYPVDQCVQHLFEAQVERAPAAVALNWDGEELTYAELNRRANHLAHYLQALGVRTETPVGVFLERSVEMLVAWLAVLKAGGAYVPLAPDYPRERSRFQLDDSGATLVLTLRELAGALGDGVRAVCVDEEAEAISRTSAANPTSATMPVNLAYVIYTSGSTGNPKGISIPHFAINRLVINTNYIAFGPSDRVAQASNASFDLSTFEVWGALLNGARLVGFPKTLVLSPPDLALELRRHEISVLILPTALFNQVARTVPTAFTSLRHVLFGGEVVDPQCVSAVLGAGPPQHLLHVYGPTESTTLATAHVVGHVDEGALTVPIGTPIANTTIYVLDAAMEPVPIGVPGELYIGGAGLARGYVNQPELTARCFVPDPFANAPGARLYRTGDLVRWRADGDLEFIGRRDFQVKLRGFRIELGEVETVLAQHPTVAQAVALVRNDTGDDRRLVAYVIGRDSTARPDAHELGQFLRSRLPDYMVPSTVVVLDALPLTPNGKLDRAALPRPTSRRPDLDSRFSPPRTPLEETLANLWAEILKLERVGIHDNFFELGGHSLLAVRLFARLSEVLDSRPSVAALFQAPTIAQLADILEKRQAHSTSPLLPLRTSGGNRPFFCVPGLAGSGFVFVELVHHLAPDRPFYALQSPGFAGGPVETSVEAIARQYVEAVRSIQPRGPYLLGGYSMGGSVAYEMASHLRADGDDVALLVMLDSACPPYVVAEQSAGSFDWGAVALAMGLRLDGATMERVLHLPLEELSFSDLRHVLASGLAPAGMRVEDVRPLIRVFKANFQAFWSYAPRPQVHRLVFLRAEERPPWHRLGNLDLDWENLAPIDVRVVPGSHHTIMHEPNVRALAAQLKACIDTADDGAARASGTGRAATS
jgi:amino acid adenylation domain-containing protein